LNQNNLNQSIAQKAVILEDPNHELSVEDILSRDDLVFTSLKKPLDILDFNTSRWFVRFSANNPKETEQLNVILETARPITSRVDLYEVQANGTAILIGKSGNERSFSEKSYKHRKNIFPIELTTSEKKEFILVMESDGELINFPLIFWEVEKFHQADYKHQFFHGFYFGILALVVFIFFFFYLLLREISFLYYILYVAFQFLLQFSLEGFSSQYIFPETPFWGNNMVLLSATGTAFFLLIYAISFLKIDERVKKWHTYFRIIIVGIIITLFLTLIPGITHALSYPIINILSLIGTLSIVIVIFVLKRRGYAISNTFAIGFIMLIIGAVIFILGNLGILGDAMVSELALKVSSGLEILALSVSMAGKYKELQEEKEMAQEKALENLERIVGERTDEVQKQKNRIEEQHKDIVGSIKYAQRIQDAFLPKDKEIERVLGEHFVLFLPRDIVSGDFYWMMNKGDKTIIVAADCTGHGVPGAFMSIMGVSFLNEIANKKEVQTAAEVLNQLRANIINSLNTDEGENKAKDGMDISICVYDFKKMIMQFAGAYNHLYFVRDGKFDKIKADRMPVGVHERDSTDFTNKVFDIQKDDVYYILSDGLIDQFGGPDGKKFMTKRFKQLIMDIYNKPMPDQKRIIEEEHIKWRGELEQIDDIILIGIKVV